MKGEGVSANMDAFMELIKNTTNDKLSGLVQKYVPPMCTTEISTRGILNVFLQEIQKIYNPILASLQIAESSGNFPVSDILTLQKIIIVVGHIAKVVPWKKPYGDCITAIFNTLIIPVLKLKSNGSQETVDLKLEAFETITKFLEIYEMQTNPFLSLILPFLETHFLDVLDNKTKKSKEASDLLGMMLQSTSKLFIPSSLVSLLKVSIVLFFSHEDPTSKIEQLDVIGHIVKKLINITKSSSLSSLSSPSPSLSSPSPSSSLSPSSSSSSSPVPSLPLSSVSPSSSSSLISPRDPEFDLQTAIHDFPYEEINHVSNFLATKILADYTNLDFWFESSVMALALFSGISARAGNLNEHKKILDMTCSTYLELLSKTKHSTKSERQFNVIFMQALSVCVDLSDKTTLQPYLSNFYSELRKLNLSTKVPADSKPMRLYFQKLRSLIIRSIASVIKAFEDFTPLADQFLRETAKELADPLILADFVEALGPHTSEYLPRVMKPLFQQLVKETVSLKLKQVIIDTITRIIKLTQKEFLPFLQECAEILRPLASFSLVTDSCLPFVSLYSTILVTFCEYPQIDGYIPLILPIFLDILNQDISVQGMGSVNNTSAKEGANDETEAMDLSPLTICEVLSNLKTIFSSPQLSKKVLSVSPTFLPELLIYLMDHIPTEIIFEEDSFIRVAQLEFIQQLLESESKEDLLGLLPLVSHILQNIEMNTNEIDVQVTSFDTLARFIYKLEDNITEETRKRIKQVSEGSKFLADDQRELKMSIERVVVSIDKLEHK